MKIALIVSKYYPNYSAVGKCIGNIADELSKDQEVIVISQLNSREEENLAYFKNQKLVRISTKDIENRLGLLYKITQSKGIRETFYKLIFNLYRAIQILKFLFSPDSIQKSMVEKYYDALVDCGSDIDLIIPASMPFESLVAAIQYKDRHSPSTRVIPYIFDQFVDSHTLHRSKLNKKLKWKNNAKIERDAINKADHVFAMHSLSDYFNSYYQDLQNITYTEHPLLKQYPVSGDPLNLDLTRVNISYVGGLYKGYVEPNYLLDLFTEIQLQDLKLNFYIIGNMSSLVGRYANLFPDRIVNHGNIDKKTTYDVLAKSDILVSIGEKTGRQISSKIFEYMSFGKPLIHFYTSDSDVNLKVLSRYPLCLCIEENKIKTPENIRKVSEFILANDGKEFLFKDVEAIYRDATPDFITDQIKASINSNAKETI